MVIVASYDLFNYSNGEPDEKYLTVLRALDVNSHFLCKHTTMRSDSICTAIADQSLFLSPLD